MVLRLAPLSPDEVATTAELLVSKTDLVLAETTGPLRLPCMVNRLFFVIPTCLTLTVELLLFDVTSVPPGTPANYLPHRRVIIPLAYVETEDLGGLLRLHTCVL